MCILSDRGRASEETDGKREKLGEGAGVGGREERRLVSGTEKERGREREGRNSELLACRSCQLGVQVYDRECFLSRRV